MGLHGILWGYTAYCGVTRHIVGLHGILRGYTAYCGVIRHIVGLHGILWGYTVYIAAARSAPSECGHIGNLQASRGINQYVSDFMVCL